MRRYIFLLIALAFLLYRTLPTIVSGRFTFAFDMGRDMLWVRNMVELKKPTLIGPWGSIAGIYFGPLWYYLLAIPYVLTNGDPRGTVLVPLLANVVALLLGWWWLRQKKHPIAASIWAVTYAASPLIISISSFAFHANLLPLALLIFLIALTDSNELIHWSKFPMAALMTSLAYHLEPAAGVMMTLFLGVWGIWEIWRNWKHLRHSFIRLFVYLFIAFSLPFAPQMIFEARHQFVQTHALVSYFRGENTSLGGELPLHQRIPERVTKFARTFGQSFLPFAKDWQMWIVLGLFFIGLVILSRKYKSDPFVNKNLTFIISFLIFHYLSYAFLFPAELKGWYLYGFVSVFLLGVALIGEALWKPWRVVFLIGVLVWISVTINPLHLLGMDSSTRSASAPALDTVAAQLQVVDWIYADAQMSKKPFSVYTYTPPIYDYNYQYLLWWRGVHRYSVLPAEFSYQPGETSYLLDKEKFISREWKPEDATVAYLILEPDQMEDRVNGWLGHFSKLQFLRRQPFSSGVAVQIRTPLPIQEHQTSLQMERGNEQSDSDEGILKALGHRILSAIKEKNMGKLIPFIDGKKGVFFSLFYSDNGSTLFPNDFKNFFTDQTIYKWGTGASGFPVRMTKAEFYSGQIDSQQFNPPLYDQDYLNAPVVGINKVVYSSGNSLNIKMFIDGFYASRQVKFVEYFFPGTEEFADHNFSVLSLIFEKSGNIFTLVGVFKDSWTP